MAVSEAVDTLIGLRGYARTEVQRKALEALIEHGTNRKAAASLGKNLSVIATHMSLIRARAASKGVAPECDMNYPVPDGFKLKGVSTLVDRRNNTTMLQWFKTDEDKARQYEMMKEAIEALAKDLPQAPGFAYDGEANESLMAFYPLGDAHIGMRSWGAETGEDWDLAIAEKTFINIFDRLVKTAPRCKQAVIVNLGDYFHSDNMAGVTERSGHSLDLDGRYAKMIEVGMKIIRRMIQSALEHHETVRVINAIGNHDDTGALFLSVALRHIYENEPRVDIDSSPAPFHYVRHGKCLVGIHHGHTCKADKLPGVMAADRAKDWGETEFRYWQTGHIHHDTLKEYPGVKVESFRTLAGKDAYAAWNGYRSGQDSKCIVLSDKHGEVERHTVNISMVR